MKELITKKGSDDGWNSSSKCTMKYSSTTMTHHASTLWKPQSKKITLKSQVKPEDPNIMEYQNISSLESKQQISGGSVIPRSHRDRGSAGRWSIYYLQLVMLLVYGKSSLSTKDTGKYWRDTSSAKYWGCFIDHVPSQLLSHFRLWLVCWNPGRTQMGQSVTTPIPVDVGGSDWHQLCH